jgi:integrase
VYRPKYTDKATGARRQQRVYWADYSIGGKRIRESTLTTRHKEALRFLHQRLAERGRGISRRDLERVVYRDLQHLIITDYRKNGRRSMSRLQSSLKHLGTFFDSWRVVDITEDAIDRYVGERLDEGAAAATVNRELAALRRMFRLGDRARMVERVPVFDLLTERNVRKGFIEEPEFAALCTELPPRQRPLAVVGYITGWRKGELLSRQWRHVDFDGGWLRLEPGETKSGEGRQFPLVPRLREALEAQAERKRAIEKRTGRIVDALFFHYGGSRAGEPIRDFRSAWQSACRRAGCPDLLFHDFRRTAVRNLVRAGVPEPVAMKLTGHLTASVFKRYAIVDESMLREGAEKLSALYDHRPTAKRRVLPLEGR